jgi:hypothetical protein
MAKRSLKQGDRVAWTASQGETTGRVEKKLTRPAEIKGHHAAASPEAPQYQVRSDKTGARAIHKPEALHKPASKSA